VLFGIEVVVTLEDLVPYEEGDKFYVPSSSPEFLSELLGASVCMQLHFKKAERIFTCHTIMFQNKPGLIKFNIPLKFLQMLCLNLYTNFCLHDLLHPYFARMRTGIHDNLTSIITLFSFAYGQCL
jgi:hypothetical protein